MDALTCFCLQIIFFDFLMNFNFLSFYYLSSVYWFSSKTRPPHLYINTTFQSRVPTRIKLGRSNSLIRKTRNELLWWEKIESVSPCAKMYSVSASSLGGIWSHKIKFDIARSYSVFLKIYTRYKLAIPSYTDHEIPRAQVNEIKLRTSHAFPVHLLSRSAWALEYLNSCNSIYL